MAELLVRVVRKYDGTDKKMISKTTARGDVIVVVPDNWQWSPYERESTQWIIIKVPASLEKCMALRSPELGDPKVDPFLRMLAFNLNLDALALLGYSIPTEQEALTGQPPRKTERIEILEAEMDLVRVTKPTIPDDAVIG